MNEKKEPILKGWVWEIPFYPTFNGWRIVKDIFWYDSSDPLGFKNFTQGYEILVPEKLIQGSEEDIKYVRDNLADIVEESEYLIRTDNKGQFKLYLTLPKDWREPYNGGPL